jgi:hypothetical protein
MFGTHALDHILNVSFSFVFCHSCLLSFVQRFIRLLFKRNTISRANDMEHEVGEKNATISAQDPQGRVELVNASGHIQELDRQ